MSDPTAVIANITRIGLDTAPIIYYVEQQSRYFPLCLAFFERIARGELHGYSSVVSLTEALTHPRRTRDETSIRAYKSLLLDSVNLSLLNVNTTIADSAADLRARYNLRTPDAIQVAAALSERCGAFLTNDRGLRRITELRVLVLDDLLTGSE